MNELTGVTFDLASFINEKFEEERPFNCYSIGGVGYETVGSKTYHVFPASDGENIYKITVEVV